MTQNTTEPLAQKQLKIVSDTAGVLFGSRYIPHEEENAKEIFVTEYRKRHGSE